MQDLKLYILKVFEALGATVNFSEELNKQQIAH